ncbi:MAG TPA: hypothetical protein PK228_21545 [Saprospiraceae bacterium]|nr:hypothetical protein [Saprospiraceae bacterium]
MKHLIFSFLLVVLSTFFPSCDKNAIVDPPESPVNPVDSVKVDLTYILGRVIESGGEMKPLPNVQVSWGILISLGGYYFVDYIGETKSDSLGRFKILVDVTIRNAHTLTFFLSHTDIWTWQDEYGNGQYDPYPHNYGQISNLDTLQNDVNVTLTANVATNLTVRYINDLPADSCIMTYTPFLYAPEWVKYKAVCNQDTFSITHRCKANVLQEVIFWPHDTSWELAPKQTLSVFTPSWETTVFDVHY